MAGLTIHANADYGYDPTVDEPIAIQAPAPAAELGSHAAVNTTYLPPVGYQITPSCAAWASTYGLATFHAARAGNYAPLTADLQASPASIYIQVMRQDGQTDACVGSQLSSYFAILDGDGTATMAQAPAEGCSQQWQDYGGSQTLPADPAFDIGTVVAAASIDLDAIKAVLASGRALVYGTSLYQDFPTYAGTPVPYVGDGHILINKTTGRPAGHCMLIIGYNDTVGSGAFLIQNSFGTGWGDNGRVWMAYDTFTALAQGKVFYLSD